MLSQLRRATDTKQRRWTTTRIGLETQNLRQIQGRLVSQTSLDKTYLLTHYAKEAFQPSVHLRNPIQRVDHAKHRAEGLASTL
jgi:hypothetical protein